MRDWFWAALWVLILFIAFVGMAVMLLGVVRAFLYMPG